eukprot:3835669-Prorocentrum_lima.AAC.1
MRMRDRTWSAFMAERFPECLDREIQKVKEAFYITVQSLEPEELWKVLPQPALSMNHLCETDGRKHYGIARFPIDEWKAQ